MIFYMFSTLFPGSQPSKTRDIMIFDMFSTLFPGSQPSKTSYFYKRFLPMKISKVKTNILVAVYFSIKS